MLNMTNLLPSGGSKSSNYATEAYAGDACTRKLKRCDAMNYIRGLDSFAQDVPAFNIGG